MRVTLLSRRGVVFVVAVADNLCGAVQARAGKRRRSRRLGTVSGSRRTCAMAAVAGESWKSELAARLGRVMPDAEAWAHLPLIEDIRELKAAHGAVVVAHNYQVPLITAGIADFTGDSLAMAHFAAQTDADTIVVCGVRFMAETAKLLSPARKVLLPAPEAGCSLAESITAADVRSLRTKLRSRARGLRGHSVARVMRGS